MTARRVTIDLVATAAGVSRQTVSRAINGMTGISDETRARILLLAQDMGYRPSRFARDLARRTPTRTIGFVVESLRNPYYTDLAADVLDVMAEGGWHVTVDSTEKRDVIAVVEHLSSHVDAIAGYLGTREEEVVAAAQGLPVLTVQGIPGPHVHSISIDFEPGMRDLLAQLRERGSRVFGMLEAGTPGPRYAPSPRRQLFEKHAGPGSAGNVVPVGEATIGAADAGLSTLLARFPQVDTVIAVNDVVAIGAVQAAHRAGLAVPGDIRIAGVDGLSLGEVVTPALTTIAIDRRRIAASARTMLGALLDGAEHAGPPMADVIPTHPVLRESA